MAKLSANANEYARLAKDTVLISVRTNKHVLRRPKGPKGHWKRWFELERVYSAPDATPFTIVKFLLSRGYELTDEAQAYWAGECP